jgi:hypothetical protein
MTRSKRMPRARADGVSSGFGIASASQRYANLFLA